VIEVRLETDNRQDLAVAMAGETQVIAVADVSDRSANRAGGGGDRVGNRSVSGGVDPVIPALLLYRC